MPDFGQLFDGVRQGTVVFLGLICLIAFVANALLLGWLLMKRGSSTLARCPKCGRMIICPHCNEDEDIKEADAPQA